MDVVVDANCDFAVIADISLTFFWHFNQTFLKRGYEKAARLIVTLLRVTP